MGKSRPITGDSGSSTIVNKLLVCFLLVALVPLTLFAYIAYRNSVEIVKKEVINNLITISQDKAQGFEAFVKRKKKDITLLAQMPFIFNSMEKMEIAYKKAGIDSLEYRQVDQEIRPYLTIYKEKYEYNDIFLISSSGEIIFTVIHESDFGTNLITGPYRKSELAKAFDRASTLLETKISDFEFYGPSDERAAFLAAPIFLERRFLGVVALRIETRELIRLTRDYTGLGKTGELVLAMKKGNRVVFKTPTRHDNKLPKSGGIDLGAAEAVPIQKAVQGEKGFGLFKDYRGIEVLAVWRYLPHIGWGMVVKIDKDEAFEPILKLTKWYLILGVITMLAVGVISFSISKTISNPIVKLTRVTEIMARGDLTIKAEVESNDELGILAQSFNNMVSELKRVEDERKAMIIKLEANKEELERFTYTVSHDLKSPLVTVKGFLGYLKQDIAAGDTKNIEDDMIRIFKATDKMQQLLDELLELSRIGRIVNPHEEIPFEKLAREAVDMLAGQLKEGNFLVEILPDLPVIFGDHPRLREVLENLVGNAIKFMGDQAGPRVEIGTRQVEDTNVYYVSDNGIGIDPQYHQKIFDLFDRLDQEIEGTGIGLAIVKRTIEVHGGQIWVESQGSGRGSTFCFTLPEKNGV